ncbi:hypothetical protein E8E14_002369 [Neopestalotiopsis sp. 37M]|nr:hypothetical protein E8E14_002369 [Neopestalotiopsis sp. 37M]
MVVFNPTPSFGSLRLASPADILRLGVVCTAGFWYSEQFTWERTAHNQYPQSTITFFRHEVRDFIKQPEFVVIVIEDSYEPDESSKTAAKIPEDNGWSPPEPGSPVVVGLTIWKLQNSSQRVGHFQNNTGSFPDLPENDYLDLDKKRQQAFADVAAGAVEEYFGEMSELERMVVHPAYWNRGHGSTLARWGVKLAQMDHVDQGVIATSMGADLFRHIGFDEITELQVDGDENTPEGVKFDALKYVVPDEDKSSGQSEL